MHPAAPSPTSTTNRRDQPAGRHRAAVGTTTSTGIPTFVDPRGHLIGDAATDDGDEVIVRDLDMGSSPESGTLWRSF